ncbi:MAG: DUF3341 domain-containing protein [Candidatus Dadabacteria bacterium]|nr:MAG: DUF3341 domain-containing protein [Candidatus Dadabacteria bacterium]
MRGSKVIVGVFSYMDDLVRAIRKAKKEGLDYRVFSPMAHPVIEENTMPQASSVRLFTLFGGILGCIGGFALAIWCSLDWPLRVSAKAIVSVPAFVVIGYECTILISALATFLGILHFCRLPDILRKVGYDPRFTDDKFGIAVGAEDGKEEAISKILSECGADEVEVREGL